MLIEGAGTSMAAKGGKPFQSKLLPFEDLIRTERKRRRSYRQIAVTLQEQHGLEVNFRTIQSFVKVRAKRPRGYQLPEPVAAVPHSPTLHVTAPAPANDNPASAPTTLADRFNQKSRVGKKRLAIEAMRQKAPKPETVAEDTGEIVPSFEPGQAYRLTRFPRDANRQRAS